MTAQPDLFNLRYPDAPGWKGKSDGPSQQAAERIAGKAATLRNRALGILKMSGGGLTADEIAAEMGEHFISVRPRIAELHRQGEIRATNIRRASSTGSSSTVWTIAPALPNEIKETQ